MNTKTKMVCRSLIGIRDPGSGIRDCKKFNLYETRNPKPETRFIGFTLIEVLVAMLIVLGSTIFLLKTIMSTQKTIIFSKHKQESIFLLEERIEQIRNMEWATVTTTEGTETIQDKHINWQIGGSITKNIGPTEFFIIPGASTETGTALGRPSIGSGTLAIDTRTNEILGGTFTVSCTWMEDNNQWATTTYTIYIATDRAFFEESRDFIESTE